MLPTWINEFAYGQATETRILLGMCLLQVVFYGYCSAKINASLARFGIDISSRIKCILKNKAAHFWTAFGFIN